LTSTGTTEPITKAVRHHKPYLFGLTVQRIRKGYTRLGRFKFTGLLFTMAAPVDSAQFNPQSSICRFHPPTPTAYGVTASR
jgi:hypothetical protein